MISVQRFGAHAVSVRPELGALGVIERAAALHAIASQVAAEVGACDLVVGGTSFLLCVGPSDPAPSFEARVRAATSSALAAARAPAALGELHELEVVYDGPDLAELSEATGLSVDEIARRHAAPTYVAILCGFMPGFAYLAEVDASLQAPRRASPRPVVPAGSVGIAGAMTGVYPFASPGGWNLVGRAVGAGLFDPERPRPRRIAPLDRVRFVPAEARAPEPAAARASPVVHAGARVLEVVSGGALASVQDRGRPGLLHQGVARGGALDPETLALANLAVGNAPGCAAIELPRGAVRLRARSGLLVSIDGDDALALAPGEELTVSPRADRGVRYVAVAGGLDVPVVLGGRSTHVVAGFGGLAGRRLRPGDVLPVGDDPGGPRARVSARGDASLEAGELVLPVGSSARDPRLGDDAWVALLSSVRTVSARSDRVGARLDGPPIPRHERDAALPEPVLPGAIQITSDGGVIVLGPDCASTGGYPVIAVLDDAACARLGRAQPGDRVRFVEG